VEYATIFLQSHEVKANKEPKVKVITPTKKSYINDIAMLK